MASKSIRMATLPSKLSPLNTGMCRAMDRLPRKDRNTSLSVGVWVARMLCTWSSEDTLRPATELSGVEKTMTPRLSMRVIALNSRALSVRVVLKRARPSSSRVMMCWL